MRATTDMNTPISWLERHFRLVYLFVALINGISACLVYSDLDRLDLGVLPYLLIAGSGLLATVYALYAGLNRMIP